jgi:integrase/recombinase XerD
MLIDDANRYVALRRSLGFKLEKTARHLAAFTRHAVDHGDSHIRTATALAWTAAVSSTPDMRYRRLQEIADFARFLRAEDARHEIPRHHLYCRPRSRPAPYIYTPDELVRMLDAAETLRRQKPSPLRRHVHATLIGADRRDGPARLGSAEPAAGRSVARRRAAHPPDQVQQEQARADARERYRRARRLSSRPGDGRGRGRPCVPDGRRQTDGPRHRPCRLSCDPGQGRDRPGSTRRPRIHDLRHTFATRALEQCAMRRADVARDFVALSTYLGHGHVRQTYWYLEATPDLMGDIAAAAEALVAEVIV